MFKKTINKIELNIQRDDNRNTITYEKCMYVSH